jgi:hypothetical protein
VPVVGARERREQVDIDQPDQPAASASVDAQVRGPMHACQKQRVRDAQRPCERRQRRHRDRTLARIVERHRLREKPRVVDLPMEVDDVIDISGELPISVLVADERAGNRVRPPVARVLEDTVCAPPVVRPDQHIRIAPRTQRRLRIDRVRERRALQQRLAAGRVQRRQHRNDLVLATARWPRRAAHRGATARVAVRATWASRSTA